MQFSVVSSVVIVFVVLATTIITTIRAQESSSSSSSSGNPWGSSSSSSNWIFPGSSSSSWSSYSSSSTYWSSSSSYYSAGSSFFTDPDAWHDAGHMTLPFAQGCSTFTLNGNARVFGGYYSNQLNYTTNIGKGLLSQNIYEILWPTTDIVQNKSLPEPVRDIAGPAACSTSSSSGITFVMRGNNGDVKSNAVFAFTDSLSYEDVSLPFKVSRSSIAASVLSEEDIINKFNQSSEKEMNKYPDAVIIGGEGFSPPTLYGLDLLTKKWSPVCYNVRSEANSRPWPSLCDCTVVSRANSMFVVVCNNCTSPVFHIYEIDTGCGFRDLIGPPSLRNPTGLSYVHALAVGKKFSVFIYRPRGWVIQKLIVAVYDHELDVWADFVPDNLDPPRIHGSFFSWLGRIQFAGGQIFGNWTWSGSSSSGSGSAASGSSSSSGGDGKYVEGNNNNNNNNNNDQQDDNNNNIETESSSSSSNENENNQIKTIYDEAEEKQKKNLQDNNMNNNNNLPFIPKHQKHLSSSSSPNTAENANSKNQQEQQQLYVKISPEEDISETIAQEQDNEYDLKKTTSSASPPSRIASIIQDVSIVKIRDVSLLATGTTFAVGETINVDCHHRLTVMIATAPDCLQMAPNSTASYCDNNDVAYLKVDTPIPQAWLCVTPGSCRISDPKKFERCGDFLHPEFSTCSGGLGCCWHPRYGCYKHDPLAVPKNNTDGAFYYLVNPKPLQIVATPAPTPNNNNHHGGNNNAPGDESRAFLQTTTGRIVIIVGAVVIGLVVIFAIILQMQKASESNVFCLHEFVSKRYDVVKELGRGGFGTVYLAVRKSDEKEVALKVIACTNEEDVQCALMEFNVLREAKPHPAMMNILDIHVSWEDANANDVAASVAAASADATTKQKNTDSPNNNRNNLPRVSSLPSLPPSPKSSTRTSPANKNKRNMSRSSSQQDTTSVAAPLIAPFSTQQPEGDVGGTYANDNLNNNIGNNNNATETVEGGGRIQQQQYVCLVMDYYSEGDLAQFVLSSFERGAGLTEYYLWNVLAKQLFSVLAHLHAQSPAIVHRDIKMENVLLADGGNKLCLTDFGLAAQAVRTFMSTRAGSFHFLAPEAWQHRYTEKIDVWSAGCILYAAATGCVVPPQARVMFNDVRHPSFAQEIRDDLRNYSSEFTNLVLSILKLNPDQRPSAQQLYQRVCEKCSTMKSLSSENNSGNGNSKKRSPLGKSPDSSESMKPTPQTSQQSVQAQDEEDHDDDDYMNKV